MLRRSRQSGHPRQSGCRLQLRRHPRRGCRTGTCTQRRACGSYAVALVYVSYSLTFCLIYLVAARLLAHSALVARSRQTACSESGPSCCISPQLVCGCSLCSPLLLALPSPLSHCCHALHVCISALVLLIKNVSYICSIYMVHRLFANMCGLLHGNKVLESSKHFLSCTFEIRGVIYACFPCLLQGQKPGLRRLEHCCHIEKHHASSAFTITRDGL